MLLNKGLDARVATAVLLATSGCVGLPHHHGGVQKPLAVLQCQLANFSFYIPVYIYININIIIQSVIYIIIQSGTTYLQNMVPEKIVVRPELRPFPLPPSAVETVSMYRPVLLSSILVCGSNVLDEKIIMESLLPCIRISHNSCPEEHVPYPTSSKRVFLYGSTRTVFFSLIK